jgi:hypothetical protein
VLASAGLVPEVQGREDADGGVQSGHHVEHRDAGAERLAVRVAGEAHQARDRLHDEVVAGQRRAAGLAAEAADRRVHDAGVGGRHGGVVEAEAGQATGLEVLHEHVGATGQLAGGREVVGVLEVQRDRPLVAIDAEVVRGDALAHRRLPRPGVVTGRPLDLDHLGAQVGQQHGRVRPGEDAGEVGDEQAGQRARGAVPGGGTGRSDGHGCCGLLGGSDADCGQLSARIRRSLIPRRPRCQPGSGAAGTP